MTRIDIDENTDKYCVVRFGGGIAYSMSAKHRNRCFFVQGDDAKQFEEAYRGLMVSYGTEGSVHYRMTKNQVLAALFDVYDHIAEDSDVSAADLVERIIN